MKLTDQEMAILLATRESENAQTAHDLAQRAECRDSQAQETIDGLVRQSILRQIESYDDRVVYGYGMSDLAQAVYCEIHQVPPIGA
jgi:hypothetical protein